MDRVGRLLILFGFLVLWVLPVAGTLIMVTGAMSTAITWEASLRASESPAIPSPVEPNGVPGT